MKITLNKIKAANIVAKNHRIQQRLPRITALAERLDILFTPVAIDAWLVSYSEWDTYPICLFFEPKFPDHYFKIEKIRILRNIKGTIINE